MGAARNMDDVNTASDTTPELEVQPLGLWARLKNVILSQPRKSSLPSGSACFVPAVSATRQHESLHDKPLQTDELAEAAATARVHHHHGGDGEDASKEKTVLYLGYGSNMASKIFQGRRGIRPLSQINVMVPEMRLTFDLPGVPYLEPCMAGSQYRKRDKSISEEEAELDAERVEENEKSGLLPRDYHKDRWRGPLIGVAYEVTLSDYANIIATEGGGSSYQDVVVSCHPFPADYKASDPVPDEPTTEPFLVHTLLSPQAPSLGQSKRRPGLSPILRPDPSFAQPSARYLGLLKTGAQEHDLPVAYRDYLADIRPYRITTIRQRAGQIFFLASWAPAILVVLVLSRLFAGQGGYSPDWVARLANTLFKSMWASYDGFYRQLFGDGERTIGDD